MHFILILIEKAKEINGIRIIRYEESLYYANVDNFKYKIIKLSKINPTAEIMKKQNVILKLLEIISFYSC